jgi:hypothetical protein
LAPVSGKLHIYWANASIGLQWPSDWQEISPPSTNNITNLPSGADWVVELQWTTIPNPTLSTGGHFCLLARFEADPTTPDPINGELLNVHIGGNVYKSNNIAWKNITVVDFLPNTAMDFLGQVFVHNIYDRLTLTKLSFNATGDAFALFSRYGTIEIDLGAKLFEKWKRGGSKGNGIKSAGKTSIRILAKDASIENLTLNPNERNIATVHFHLKKRPPADSDHLLDFDFVEHGPSGKSEKELVPIGGERFEVSLGKKRVQAKKSGSASEIHPKQTSFDYKTSSPNRTPSKVETIKK